MPALPSRSRRQVHPPGLKPSSQQVVPRSLPAGDDAAGLVDDQAGGHPVDPIHRGDPGSGRDDRQGDAVLLPESGDLAGVPVDADGQNLGVFSTKTRSQTIQLRQLLNARRSTEPPEIEHHQAMFAEKAGKARSLASHRGQREIRSGAAHLGERGVQ